MQSGSEEETVSGLISDIDKSWDMEFIRELCNERDRALIQQLPTPNDNRLDSWYWILDGKGEFTVKSCYRKMRGESTGQEDGLWKKLWSLQLPGKVLNFLWRACHNVLPTTVELAKKQVDVSLMCAWCQEQIEEATHTLFTCNFARTLWLEVGLQEVTRVETGMNVKDILKREFSRSNRERCVKIGLFCWGLWSRRNTWVWDKRCVSVFGVRSMVTNILQEWQQSQEEMVKSVADVLGVRSMVTNILQEWQQSQEEMVKSVADVLKKNRRWCKPPEGWIKINMDAACRSQTGEVGVACVVRNDRGEFLRARSNRFYGSARAREAEALSLKEALMWIKDWRNQKCIFELDSKLVIDAVHDNRGNSIFHSIIDECISMLKHFSEVLVVFEYRPANSVAHLLARAALSMSGLMEWYHTAPEMIRCNLIYDAN